MDLHCFELDNPFALSDDSTTSGLFHAEHPLRLPGAAAAPRRAAAAFIIDARSLGVVDRFVAYLALNYVDRFLAARELPARLAVLLAVACLSLAAKMLRPSPVATELQGVVHAGASAAIDGRALQRMEMLVLSAMEWRARSITPFAFLRHFLRRVRPISHSPASPLAAAVEAHAVDTLLKIQDGTYMAEFRPSLIAAAALHAAVRELAPARLAAFRRVISSSEFVNNEELIECCKKMAAIAGGIGAAGAAGAGGETPVTVLAHHRCPSCDSDWTVGSASDDPDARRCHVGGGRVPGVRE